tara:strand:+ start:103 stop:588 length:486 start_codon:yes stop_codon:yes gene_type:complete
MILKYIYNNRNQVKLISFGHEISHENFKALGVYAVACIGEVHHKLYSRTSRLWEPTLDLGVTSAGDSISELYSRSLYQAALLFDHTILAYSRAENFIDPLTMPRYDSSFSLGVIESTLGLPSGVLNPGHLTAHGIIRTLYGSSGMAMLADIWRADTISISM